MGLKIKKHGCSMLETLRIASSLLRFSFSREARNKRKQARVVCSQSSFRVK